MRLVLKELRSRLQYKIIIPFLLLTLCVVLAGLGIAYTLLAGSWQERLDNQLAEVARTSSDRLVDQERTNLQFLYQATFAPENQNTGAPSVADAVANGDNAGLTLALDPYFRNGVQNTSIRLDRLITFDHAGRTLFDWERLPDTPATEHVVQPPLDLSQTWFVPRVLAASEDGLGDKFAGLILMPDTKAYYLGTIAPVRQDGKVVGGMIIAMRIDTLLEALRQRSQAAIVTLYDGTGTALASTSTPSEGFGQLTIPSQALKQLSDNGNGDKGVLTTGTTNAREYEFAYSPLQIRSTTIGILSVALPRDYVVSPLADVKLPLYVLTAVFTVAIAGMGMIIARVIAAPLRELVDTARAVRAGDLQRRSTVRSADEVGELSRSFNTMTEYLLEIYSERAAIVESIVDGIVMCDTDGNIKSANRAMRSFLHLADEQELPKRFSDLPLEPMAQTAGFSERRILNLYAMNERIMRVSASPVVSDTGERLGIVCVLQDMTAEIAVDQAKTNFIATISHELRTPLTVMRGNADLLLRGLIGPLDAEQRSLIETMRNHASNMATLVGNVITIAGLDSGSLVPDPESLNLCQVLEEIVWPLRTHISAKGLELRLQFPPDVRPVRADPIHLRTIMVQLLDNARRYTQAGSITVRVSGLKENAQVDVCDTGDGIPSSVHAHLFQRFIRGDGTSEGINSAERGIGLGLAIVKQLVERQSGQAWLAETSQYGTTFSFTLPYTDATHQLAQPTQNGPVNAAA